MGKNIKKITIEDVYENYYGDGDAIFSLIEKAKIKEIILDGVSLEELQNMAEDSYCFKEGSVWISNIDKDWTTNEKESIIDLFVEKGGSFSGFYQELEGQQTSLWMIGDGVGSKGNIKICTGYDKNPISYSDVKLMIELENGSSRKNSWRMDDIKEIILDNFNDFILDKATKDGDGVKESVLVESIQHFINKNSVSKLSEMYLEEGYYFNEIDTNIDAVCNWIKESLTMNDIVKNLQTTVDNNRQRSIIEIPDEMEDER